MILSTETTIRYVVQNRETKLYCRGRELDCTAPTRHEAKQYETRGEAMGFCASHEAVFAITTTTTVTLSVTEENPFE